MERISYSGKCHACWMPCVTSRPILTYFLLRFFPFLLCLAVSWSQDFQLGACFTLTAHLQKCCSTPQIIRPSLGLNLLKFFGPKSWASPQTCTATSIITSEHTNTQPLMPNDQLPFQISRSRNTHSAPHIFFPQRGEKEKWGKKVEWGNLPLSLWASAHPASLAFSPPL